MMVFVLKFAIPLGGMKKYRLYSTYSILKRKTKIILISFLFLTPQLSFSEVSPSGPTTNRGSDWETICPENYVNNKYYITVEGENGIINSNLAKLSPASEPYCNVELDFKNSSKLINSYLPLGKYNWQLFHESGRAASEKILFEVIPLARTNFSEDNNSYISFPEGSFSIESGFAITDKNLDSFLWSRSYSSSEQMYYGDFMGEFEVFCPDRQCSVGIVVGATRGCKRNEICAPRRWLEIELVEEKNIIISVNSRTDSGVNRIVLSEIKDSAVPYYDKVSFRIVRAMDKFYRIYIGEKISFCFYSPTSLLGGQTGLHWRSWDDDEGANTLRVDWLLAAAGPELIPTTQACHIPLPQTR